MTGLLLNRDLSLVAAAGRGLLGGNTQHQPVTSINHCNHQVAEAALQLHYKNAFCAIYALANFYFRCVTVTISDGHGDMLVSLSVC